MKRRLFISSVLSVFEVATRKFNDSPVAHIIFLLGGAGLRKQILSVNVFNRSCYFLDVVCLVCDGFLVFLVL